MSPPRKKTTRGADFANLRGVWRSHGYGNVLEIGPTRYTLYDETTVSCLPVFEGSLDELVEHYVDVQVSPRGRAFRVRRAAGVTLVRFRRLKELPRNCTESTARNRLDPEYNFEVFWHTFAEHYALFELRGVDWDSLYAVHRPQVDQDTKPKRLFEIFVEMLRPLCDGHVELRASFGQFNAGSTVPLHDRLAAELGETPDAPAVSSHLVELRKELWDTIREHYLQSRPRRSCGGLLEWGRLDEKTGYLAVGAMAGLSGAIGWPRDDFDALDAAMDDVLEDLGHLATMVVDLRDNGGGYDSVALQLAGYLTDRKRLTFNKAARRGETYTGKQAIPVEPSEAARYGGRLVVLTSGLTASAAEVFVLALLQHPRLTLVGEPTHGILSDAMERHLPNGWLVTLSNELYRAFDGALYEDCGVPPHVEIPFLDRRDRASGRDGMLDFVLGRR